MIMNYNDKRKRLDVQVGKIYNKKHYEVTTAPIPGPKEPSFQTIVLAFIKEQKCFNKRIEDILERHGSILEKHSSILEKHSSILEKHSLILEKHDLILERNNLH
ncbi:hypothetical protein FACS1894166_02070 [Bacilli bacterium]|nr:hypothetical protein FACS1894166_02070 [Bacilli bacterium]